MQGVWYAGIAVVLVLGLLFLLAYSRRGRQLSSGSSPALGTPGRNLASAGSAARDSTAAAQPDLALSRPGESAGSAGDVSADSDEIRRLVQSESAALRRAAEVEAEATRRAARAEAASAAADAQSLRSRAEGEAAELLATARRTAEQDVARRTGELRQVESELAAESRRLEEAESRLSADARRVSAESIELDRGAAQLAARQEELSTAEAALAAKIADLDSRAVEFERELERVAGLTAEQAKAELLAGVEVSARRDAATLVRSIENEAKADATARARVIVADAVQRVASEQTAAPVVSVVHLPGEDMKGRIIGREGRNIRAFESVTGVNVIIDDTPEAVLLSCFDPVRREVGRLTLERLVVDGRIHPHRIEEAHELSVAEVDRLCDRAARDALAEVGIRDLDEALVPTLGRLRYRTSYGQNVLGHLVETAHIAGAMAAELGLEPNLIKRCAFLHDIGKAFTHEVEGSHAIIGADLLRRHGESEAVAHAVEAHHNEVPPRTIEAVLTQASDSCSAARPGARRESLEAYVKRLARIEEIATTKPGVEKVFAMQAGREVRVMVLPSEIDDLAASVLAREIAKQIEDELTYPGQIRVTVVRESRATEIAH
jgi:ribonuclease Y